LERSAEPMLYEDARLRFPPRSAGAAERRYNGATFTPRDRMENPLLGQQPLPQFLQIRPEHVEPAVREVLTQNRARIEELASLPLPTFATLIEPLEELQHRISRTWSPVSHLNAVLNSDALRSGYNACLPLLSAYQTDLAQSEPLFRAYRTVAEHPVAHRGRVGERGPGLLRGVDDARLGLRPGRRPLGQLGGDGRDPAAAPRSRSAAGFSQLHGVRARDPHGPQRR